MAEPAASPSGPSLRLDRLVIAFAGVGTVMDIPRFDLPGGSVVAVEGPSGSGKTSLLHVLAGLERPSGGTVHWTLPGGEAVSVWSLPDRARDAWRRRAIGLVFQDIHLLEGFSALGNVTLPLLFGQRGPTPAQRTRALALLALVGIPGPDRPITVMSRGERQRVAIARALLPGPGLLLADEPTASLDRHSAGTVARLLVEAAAATGATLIVTSHDPVLLEQIPTRLRLLGGQLELV